LISAGVLGAFVQQERGACYEYTTGYAGELVFHSLATDPPSCQVAIQQLCAEQKAKVEEELAEIAALPPEEEPYDPMLPSGCTVVLCMVLPDQHYLPIQRQKWHNNGQTLHPAGIPDLFAVAYYRGKVQRGEYNPASIKW
jgi:hypothetical protein